LGDAAIGDEALGGVALGAEALGDEALGSETMVDDAFGDKAFGAGGRLTAADERAMGESLIEAREQNKNIVAKSSRASQRKIDIAKHGVPKSQAFGRRSPKRRTQ
jgi:hypothetical protein